MMKKEYEVIEMEVIEFSVESVLITSGDELPTFIDPD